MNQIEAFRETLTLAKERGMQDVSGFGEGTDYWHLQDMFGRVEQADFSPAKMGRWLGWAQGAVVANGFGTLEEMKEINRRWA